MAIRLMLVPIHHRVDEQAVPSMRSGEPVQYRVVGMTPPAEAEIRNIDHQWVIVDLWNELVIRERPARFATADAALDALEQSLGLQKTSRLTS
jgi:hypothetical protein